MAISARSSFGPMAYPVSFLHDPDTSLVSSWARDGTICFWLAHSNWEAPYWKLWQVWFMGRGENGPVPGDGPYYFWWYGYWPMETEFAW